MHNTYDAIIIGSGLGGLSCGATLPKAGKRVLVLEQHSLIGGCATCFKRKGMLVDAGLHEMDFGKPNRDIEHIIFKHLELDKKLEPITLPSAWSIIETIQMRFLQSHMATRKKH
ncbi:NAD(P)-binding protein [Helicobacter trogontum]|uniref:FAD-binding protein n=1 Tax=Helicobacter trogontum TaxID=50960 RepID=A0A4U8TCT8_9HELI|nr:NAD(P)-binding protein [Helicobacter trogontum]MDY5185781.1 NAD(P)-binding protein [Helicobacter trogontum]TLD96457.1 FAD-binding protein [Helicobacter trogontum]